MIEFHISNGTYPWFQTNELEISLANIPKDNANGYLSQCSVTQAHMTYKVFALMIALYYLTLSLNDAHKN